MPGIIPPQALYTRVLTHYDEMAVNAESDVQAWLDQCTEKFGENFVPILEKWISNAVWTISKSAVEQAAMQHKWRVECQVDLVEVAKRVLAKANPRMRRTMPEDKLQYALCSLATHSGYPVEDKKIMLVFSLLADDADDDFDAVAPDAIEVPPDELPAPDGLDPDEPQTVETPIQIGHVYGNGNGVAREITAMDAEKIAYKVVQSTNQRIKVGSVGNCAIKSFVTWQKEDLGPAQAAE